MPFPTVALPSVQVPTFKDARDSVSRMPETSFQISRHETMSVHNMCRSGVLATGLPQHVAGVQVHLSAAAMDNRSDKACLNAMSHHSQLVQVTSAKLKNRSVLIHANSEMH